MHEFSGRVFCAGLAGSPPCACSPMVSSPSLHSNELTRATVKQMVREEQALELDDILFRRTPRGWDEDMGLGILSQLANWLGEELGWSATERSDAIDRYKRRIKHQYSFNTPTTKGEVAIAAESRRS